MARFDEIFQRKNLFFDSFARVPAEGLLGFAHSLRIDHQHP